MRRLDCPFCGPRELEEFHFLKTRAEPDATPFGDVYQRINRVDASSEHWQHVSGCRAWLLVTRNPSTGEVLDVKRLSEVAP